VDRAFVAAMIPHHESAVEMAEIAQERGESDMVKQLAEASSARRTPRSPRCAAMGMDGDMSMLERADPFDRAFLR
jgi:uncharacterized protein (DUF305 family)